MKSSIQEIKSLLDEYLQTLTGVVDDFWEEHILTADVYIIRKNQEPIGCFTLHNKEKITMFYIQSIHVYMAQDIFKRILSDFCVQTAFVATCDLLFLNCAWISIKKSSCKHIFSKTVGCLSVSQNIPVGC